MINVGVTCSSTISGTKRKVARCVHCACVYTYAQTNTVTGKDNSPYCRDFAVSQQRAKTAAERLLASRLNIDEPAPCPKCGWIQPAMVRVMSWRRSPVPGALTLAVCLAAGVGLLSAPLHVATLILCAAAIPSAVLWWIQRRNFNPNAMASERIGKPSDGMPETHELDTFKTAAIDSAMLAELKKARDEFEAKAAKNPQDWAAR